MKNFSFLIFLAFFFFNTGCDKKHRIKNFKRPIRTKLEKVLEKNDFISFIDEQKTLEELERNGLHFGQWFSESLKPLNNKELYKNSYYRSIIREIRSDLELLKSKDPFLSVTMAKSHRLFDWRWTKSKDAHFELVGISNRQDRLSFSSHTCLSLIHI